MKTHIRHELPSPLMEKTGQHLKEVKAFKQVFDVNGVRIFVCFTCFRLTWRNKLAEVHLIFSDTEVFETYCGQKVYHHFCLIKPEDANIFNKTKMVKITQSVNIREQPKLYFNSIYRISLEFPLHI